MSILIYFPFEYAVSPWTFILWFAELPVWVRCQGQAALRRPSVVDFSWRPTRHCTGHKRACFPWQPSQCSHVIAGPQSSPLTSDSAGNAGFPPGPAHGQPASSSVSSSARHPHTAMVFVSLGKVFQEALPSGAGCYGLTRGLKDVN